MRLERRCVDRYSLSTQSERRRVRVVDDPVTERKLLTRMRSRVGVMALLMSVLAHRKKLLVNVGLQH